MDPSRRRHRRLQRQQLWGLNEVQEHEQEYEHFVPRLMAARLRHDHPVDVARFMQNLRNMLQRQRVHFDKGEGDGAHVWTWRQPARPFPENGGGDAFPNQQPPGGNAANRRRHGARI